MKFVRFVLVWIISVFLIVTACKIDSSGSDDGNADTSGISYTGLTSQATIDSSNATYLARGAYTGTTTGSQLTMSVASSPSYAANNNSSVLVLIQELGDTLLTAYSSSKYSSGDVIAHAIITDSGTEYGDCGGSSSYTMEADDVTGEFTATIIFYSFCSSGTTFSGTVSYSGKIDIETGDPLYITASFDSLTINAGYGSVTLKGNIYYDEFYWSLFEISFRATSNFLILNNATGQVFKLEYYTVVYTATANYLEFDVSGKYYHPDYGYVIVSTTTPFRIAVGNSYPSQGVLVVSGKTGIAGGSTAVQLTVLSSTQYQIEANTNGDGLYDWSSGAISWSNN